MKLFYLLVVLILGLLGGGCSQTKQILMAGPVVPKEVGYHINVGNGWVSLAELEAKQIAVDATNSSPLKITAGGMITNILPIKNGKLLVAKRLTPTEKIDPATTNEPKYCIYAEKLEVKGRDVHYTQEYITPDDRSDQTGDGYLLFEFRVPPRVDNVVYEVTMGCDKWIVVQ